MPGKKREVLLEELTYEIRAFQNAVDMMDDIAATLMGLNRTDQRCLDLLLFEGPMTAGKLAEATAMSTGATTTVIDRLEAAGYVRRERETVDRRKVTVHPTQHAREMAERLYAPIGERGFKQLERYTTAELALLCDFMRLGRELNQQRAWELRQGEPAEAKRAEVTRTGVSARR